MISESNCLKNFEKKYNKFKFTKNLFNKNTRKEKPRLNNKNKIISLDIENFYIYKRINNATSIYPTKNFKKDFELSQSYKTNICKLPKINFKNYIKPSKNRELPKKLYKLNYDNFFTANTNLTLSSKNNYDFNYDDLDDECISLYFYFDSNLNGHPYIIVSSPDEFFYEVIKKLCNTVPNINKDKIIAYKYEDEKKTEIQTFKTIKDNELKDKSKIIIEFEQ